MPNQIDEKIEEKVSNTLLDYIDKRALSEASYQHLKQEILSLLEAECNRRVGEERKRIIKIITKIDKSMWQYKERDLEEEIKKLSKA